MRQLDLTERLLRLRGVPVFRAMSSSELAPLAATMRSATFEKGDVILREDEPPAAFHMLVTGQVTMRRHGRKIRTIAAPGGVGFLSLLARTGGGTEAVAEAHTETFEVRADAIEELFEDHFSVLLGTLRWVTERVIQENLLQEPPAYVPRPTTSTSSLAIASSVPSSASSSSAGRWRSRLPTSTGRPGSRDA